MATIPTIQPNSSLQSTHMPYVTIQDVGGSHSGGGLGNIIKYLVMRRKEINDSTMFSQAQSDIMSGAANIRHDISANPDTESHEQEWNDKYSKLLSGVIDKQNHEVKSALRSWGAAYGASQKLSVVENSYKTFIEQQAVAVDEIGKQRILIATDQKRSPEERLQAREDFQKQLQVRTDIFTPVEIQKRLDKFNQEVDITNVYNDLLSGKEIDWNQYPAVPPIDRQDLIEKATRWKTFEAEKERIKERANYENNINTLFLEAQKGHITNEDMESFRGKIERKDFEEIQKNRELAAEGITDPIVQKKIVEDIQKGDIRSEQDIWNNPSLSIQDKTSLAQTLTKRLELSNKPNYEIEKYNLDKRLIDTLQLKEDDSEGKRGIYYNSLDKYNQLVGSGTNAYQAKRQVLDELQKELEDEAKRKESQFRDQEEFAKKILSLKGLKLKPQDKEK